MDPFLLVLLIFGAQLLVIVGVAAVAETLGRVTDPGFLLTYWRGVGLACVALPFSAFAPPEAFGSGVTFLIASAGGAESELMRAVLPPASTVVSWLLCAGAVARLGWLCAGAVRLRQLRQRSRATVLTPDLEQLRADVAPRAEVRLSSDIAQPAGFGLRHPVILLPDTLFAMDPNAQRPVVYHELLHVARRDWPCIVVEEMARALFWFHPAVWWLLERIQESREQLVDRLVIARMPPKRAYMTALLAFADGGRPPAAATALLWRRHLRSRLRGLAKESVMSRRRLAWTAAVLACVMSGAVTGAVVALPLDLPIGEAAAPAQQVADGKDPGVTMPKVVSEVRPQYTPEAMRARIQGTVMMTTVVGIDGTPGDIQITKSLDAEYGLDEQAIAALAQWQFEPGRKDGKPVPVRVTVEMRFTLKK
jgi:TonB family protein